MLRRQPWASNLRKHLRVPEPKTVKYVLPAYFTHDLRKVLSYPQIVEISLLAGPPPLPHNYTLRYHQTQAMEIRCGVPVCLKTVF